MDAKEFEQYCLINSSSFICIHEPTLKFISVSSSCEKITGYEKEELEGKNAYDFFHADDRENIQKNGHQAALDGKKNVEIIYRFNRKNGGFTWLKTSIVPCKNGDGTVTSLLSISNDYSEFAFAHKEFSEKEKLYNRVLRAAGIGLWEINLERNSVIWSKTTYDIYEVDYTEYIKPETAPGFFADEFKDAIKEATDRAVNNGISYDITVSIITAKNNRKWIRVIGNPGFEFGKTVKLYGVFQDITKDKDQQISLKAVADKLSNQKRQLEDFNQIISHNLRSPVTNIGILLNLLKTSTHEEERNLFFDKLSFATANLNSLLDDLVDVVKVISSSDVQMDKIRMDEMIRSTSCILEGNINETGASIQIHTADWNEIEYPKLYMESIVLNLMSNALKYVSPERRPFITIATGTENNKKFLEVSDNGLGIDLHKYGDQVFKLHKTFHREKQGKGLGLFMTKNQVEAMGGTITVCSEVNKGTTFKIIFDNNK